MLWELPAILKYLAAKHPERKLAAPTPKQAARSISGCSGGAAVRKPPSTPSSGSCSIKPKVLNQPGNDPGIIADAHTRIDRFLPVLDKQLDGRDYIVGPLSIADFAIGPRFDRAPELLNFDIAPYTNIGAWMSGCAPSPIGARPSSLCWPRRS